MAAFLVLCAFIGLANDTKTDQPSVDIQATRAVLSAIVRAAEANARKQRSGWQGDSLGDQYVRAAAEAAAKAKSARPFLVAMGVAVDDSNLLRKNFLLRSFLTQIEPDTERQKRLRVLGKPSLRKRNDWMLHFWISAALTAQAGPAVAEQFGIAKELMDARGSSGFSFADLAADYAGIALAQALLADDDEGMRRLRTMASEFRGVDYLPAIDDLEDGLTQAQFEKKYGSISDPRFLEARAAIKTRVEKATGTRWFYDIKRNGKPTEKK